MCKCNSPDIIPQVNAWPLIIIFHLFSSHNFSCPPNKIQAFTEILIFFFPPPPPKEEKIHLLIGKVTEVQIPPRPSGKKKH